MQEETADLSLIYPRVPGFKVIGLLGEGGMGCVYLGEDEKIGRKVAIKVVSEALVRDFSARERFMREARAMATVDHPHLVRVYAFGETTPPPGGEGAPFFVMEFIEGRTLAARMRSAGGPLPPEDALRFARQTAEGLRAAWKKGIAHRDIKPVNILLDAESNVRVADFGLAKPLAEAGHILGNPLYMSPEQGRGEEMDFRSDIYSLGIVLYEMLAGSPPFEGTTPLSVIAKHLTEPLPPLRERRPGLPDSLYALVERMAAKSPAERFTSHDHLLKAMGEALVTEARSENPSTGQP